MKDKHYKARYIQAVSKYLSDDIKTDVELELNSLIDEQLKEEAQTIETVLKELGSPKKLAAAYEGKTHYLIGPNAYDSYFMVLKIVGLVAFIGITIALIIEALFTVEYTFFSFIVNYILTISNAFIQIFAIITIIFFVIERYDSKSFDDDMFDLDDLPELVDQTYTHKLGDVISNIFFLILVFGLINFTPSVIAIFSMSDGSVDSVPVLDLVKLEAGKVFINIGLIIGMIRVLMRLYFKGYTKSYVMMNGLFLLSQTVFFVLPFLLFDLINPDLNQQLTQIGISPDRFFVQNGLYIFITLFVIGSLVELVVSFYRYKQSKFIA